jgi:acyl-coenzyme A synthetase/AMP-(fatty) acid ligase
MNIRELLEKQAEEYPEKIFLYFNKEKVTYQNLDLQVNRVANTFKKMGIEKGDMAAIMLPNSPEFLYTWFGLNKIGAIEVPINSGFQKQEIEYILQHSESKAIVIHEQYYPFLKKIPNDCIPALKHIVVLGESENPFGTISFSELLEGQTQLEPVDISEDSPAVCIYTSGTTDKPKGVLNSHKGWVLTGEAYAYTVGITDKDRVMTPNPLFHANAQVYSTMGSLVSGASLILLERFSTSRIIEQARTYGATKMVLVQGVTPWVWSRPQMRNDGDNPIKKMIAGNVPVEYYRDFEERFQLKIQTIYSLTEAPLAIMGPREGTHAPKIGGVGVPMEHPNPSIVNEVKIIDKEGQEQSPGVQGEIIIRNPATMIEYYKDPTKTAETKVDGWIYTGDIGYKDEDGYVYFVGRLKEVIRRRGELIAPNEIETVINSLDSVAESAVIGVPSALGTGEEEVKAYIQLKPDKMLKPEEIITYCAAKLAAFKVPRYIEFRNEFPRSAVGRIQKNILKKEQGNLIKGCYDREEQN